MHDDFFHVAHSLQVPGLGLLLLPTAPAPAWLLGPALHTALAVALHQPSQPAQSLLASIEEVSQADQLPARALLLTTHPGGPVATGAWLAPLDIGPDDLLFLV